MSDVEYHSKDIYESKAKEKREIFVNIQEKKTLKQSAEEFQKKFAEAKAHAQETRDKIENPGADSNGVIRSAHRQIAKKPIILALIIIALSVGGYFTYPYVIDLLTPDAKDARDQIKTDQNGGSKTYEKLIERAKDSEEKSDLLAQYGYALVNTCGESCIDKINGLFKEAETISPSADTAYLKFVIENMAGKEAEANSWYEKSQKRGNISLWWETTLWRDDAFGEAEETEEESL